MCSASVNGSLHANDELALGTTPRGARLAEAVCCSSRSTSSI
jgi:hypothetical protein